MITQNQKTYTFAVLSALCMSLAWFFPGTKLCAALGWAAALALIPALDNPKHFYRPLYLCGVITNALGFYWLYETIHSFGGFPYYGAAAVFLLFVLLSAVQYLIFAFCFRNLPQFLDAAAVRAGIAWVVAEVISVRLFPWYAGHTQLGLVELAQLASLGGALLISLLIFWVAEAFWILLRQHGRMGIPWLAPAALALAYYYGFSLAAGSVNSAAAPQKVALVQANITSEERNNTRFFRNNTQRYLDLTAELAAQNSNLLIIWPESSFQVFVPTNIQSAEEYSGLPYYGRGHAMLIGTLSFDPALSKPKQLTVYNSAMAISADGTIPALYHKQILMPFGEFMPLASWIPGLKELNPNVGDFSAGKELRVYEIETGQRYLKAAPLICYEDMVPELAREATLKGAEILINLTNDSWFGNTIALHQHHVIASFRAIENRRYLLRSTNTGLTAVVNPLGQTLGALPPFSEGILYSEVVPNSVTTLFTQVGNKPWWALVLIAACLIGLGKAINRNSRRL